MLATPDEAKSAVVDALADALTALPLGHPTRVAVDGRSAAGKTTLADELAVAVRARGREVPRASIDDFHRPGHNCRSRRGGWTPQSYYDEGYDYDAFRDLLPRPLGPGGNRRCRPALVDSFQDAWLPEAWREVDTQAVVIVDGAFLLRPELADHWDSIIWLEIDHETMVERARRRDAAWVGSADVIPHGERPDATPKRWSLVTTLCTRS